MRKSNHVALVALLAMTAPAIADDDWVATSDANAQEVHESVCAKPAELKRYTADSLYHREYA